MISYLITSESGTIKEIDEITKGCWMHLVAPTEDELSEVISQTGVDETFLRAALDDEETSRIEAEDGQTLIIMDLPMVDKTDKNQVIYSTVPIGVVLHGDYIITVCLKESIIINDIMEGKIRNIQTVYKTRFVLQFLFCVVSRFLQYLRQIDKLSKLVEKQLHKSMKNKELIQLLDLEKSLVFFSTSLNANEMTLKKIMRGNIIKLYEEDEDLLEDVLIETKQAIEMANIYSSILSGTMDAFASVISNNLNIVMKVLTSITILMTIPNIVFSFYGMNVASLPLAGFWWFPLGLSVLIALVTGVVLAKKGLF